MNQLLAVLRLRPVLVTLCGIVLSILTYFLLWPTFVSGDRDRRGALALTAMLALWAICEWGYLALKHYREQRTRPGQLRQLFNGALRHLEREAHGGGFMNADSLQQRPWLLLLGTAESGTARLLERAGFRRIVSCTPPGEAPVCTFWLSQDSAGGSVCIEVCGSALIDTEGCEQLYRWLRRLRGVPDAVLLQVALQEMWGSDEERARAVAVQLSPPLHTLLRECPGELPIHIICNQLARVEGMARYFGSAERRPWGFRLDRPLHSEFQASLVHERAQAIISALWQRVNLTLVSSSIEANDVESLLDFPREMRRMSVLLGAFITKLCESFSADTRARLYEVFFANAEPGTPFEATRHRRLPLSRSAAAVKTGAPAEEGSSYFLQGLFVRVARLTTQEPTQRAPRQTVALWTVTALCVVLMTLASTFYARRHRGQLVLRRQVDAVLTRLEQLTRLQPPDPQHVKTLQTDMASFLKMDHELAAATERMERAKRLYALNTPLQRPVEDLQRTIFEYGQCQAANHLISPLLRYEPKDISKQHVQPLYDPLHSLIDVGDGKRRPARPMVLGPLATTDWFDALYAIALLQRRPSCTITPQDAKWLTHYLHALWKVDPEGVDRGVSRDLEARMGDLLASYLQERKVCSLLGDTVDRRPVGAAQRALSSSSGPSSQPGIDIAAALELELRIKSSSKDRSDRGFKPTSLTYFSARDDMPADATRAGCQQIMAANAAEIRWLRCILPEEAAANLQDRGVGNNRLAAQYMSRIEAMWSSWLSRLSRKPRQPTGNLENDLADLSTAVGSVMQDIPVLFRLLGVGDLPKGESLEICRQSLRSFAPFRWAVDVEDEQGGKHAELQAQWKDYSTELVALRDQLNLLGRPAKPPTSEEALRTVLSGIQSLQRAEQRRISWLKMLRAALLASQGPASFQESLGQFAQQLQKLEAEIMQSLLRKGRRLVACQWSSLRQQWGDTLTAAAGGAGQAGAEDPRGAALRALLIRFRDTTITPFESVPQLCEMHAFRLSESMGEDSGQIVNSGFCRRAKDLLSVTGIPVVAKPATPDPVAAPPSIIPTPDGRCSQPADSVLQTILDVPDLQSRYICNISRRECVKSGPNIGTSGKVLLRVDWAGGGTSEAVSLGTLREFLAPPASTRSVSHRVRSEIDPWRQESRHVVEVSAPTLCRGRTFRIYFDEAVAGRSASKSPWPDAGQLETAGQLLLESACR